MAPPPNERAAMIEETEFDEPLNGRREGCSWDSYFFQGSNKCIASSNKCLTSSNTKLLVTSATLVVTNALLVVTRSY